jgi:hypothetical protein
MRQWHFPVCGVLLGTVAAWMIYPAAVPYLKQIVPIAFWFEVRSVEVSSIHAGEIPRVQVDRTIRRPFTAEWIVTLRRMEEDGFSVFCSRQGRNDYRPFAELPAQTDLNWWMDIPPNEQCPPLVPGNYIMTFAWQVEIEGIPPRSVRIDSNIFEVEA